MNLTTKVGYNFLGKDQIFLRVPQKFAPSSSYNLTALTLLIIVDAVTSSGILKAKQKLGVTFNFDKQDIIDLTKFSKMTMCRASEANSEK